MHIPGINKVENDIKIAIALYQNNGGTYTRLLEIASEAYSHEAGAGHATSVSQPINARPTPSQAGTVLREHQIAEGRPNRPMVEPSKAQRNAAASVAKEIARTLMDSIILSSGKSIGDVRWGKIDAEIESELRSSREHMARSGLSARNALALQRIKGLVANAKPSDKIRDCVGLPLLETTWKETEQANAA